ncbi:hypothetical protein B0H13DRAFT_2370550 [Mycena leptocephala]|nr:hypothetical protein B0H13DRAFT_2370550 [Mycena leptocephala]
MPSPMLKPSAAIHHSADFLCTLIETEIAHAVQPYQNALASVKALASLDAVVKGFATDPTTYKPISPASIVEVLAQCISRMEAGDWNGTCACVAKYPRDAQSALRDTTAARSSAPYDLKYWGMKASASDRQPRVQNAIGVYVELLKSKVAIQHAFSLGLKKKTNPEDVECEAEQCVVDAKIGRNATQLHFCGGRRPMRVPLTRSFPPHGTRAASTGLRDASAALSSSTAPPRGTWHGECGYRHRRQRNSTPPAYERWRVKGGLLSADSGASDYA